MTRDHRPELEDLHRQLVERFTELTTDEQWLAALADARKFHRYSPTNQLLLAMQGARGHVAGYRTWQRIDDIDGNPCQVAKGEKGLSILAPLVGAVRNVDPDTGDESASKTLYGFRVVKVFHEGQLAQSPAIARPPLPELLTGENRHQHIWTAITRLLDDAGYTVELVERSPLDKWNGRTRYLDRAVEIGVELEPPQRIKTLLHEWAHIHLDHEHHTDTPQDAREVEAESVAYLIAQTIELETAGYSIPYVAGWSGGDGELVLQTAERVIDTANSMVTDLERSLNVSLEPELVSHGDQVVSLRQTRTEATGTALTSEADLRTVNTPAGFEPPSGAANLLGRLAPEDRARLIEALFEPDDHIDTVVELCADAGASAADIAGIADAYDISSDAVWRAMRSATTESDDGPQLLFDPDEIAAAFPAHHAEALASQQRHPTIRRAVSSEPEVGLDPARIFATRIAAGADGQQLADLANGLGLSTRDALIAAANGGATDDQLAHLALGNQNSRECVGGADLAAGTAAEASPPIEASTGHAALDIIRRWDLLAQAVPASSIADPEKSL